MSIQKQTEFVSVGLKSRMDGEPSKFTALTPQFNKSESHYNSLNMHLEC